MFLFKIGLLVVVDFLGLHCHHEGGRAREPWVQDELGAGGRDLEAEEAGPDPEDGVRLREVGKGV